jgi:fermentation-respiration switch protein FrsA (DUF1100 family)
MRESRKLASRSRAAGWLGAFVAWCVVAGAAAADFTRQDVEFDADGVTLRGWLYLPAEANAPVPAIVMSHGWSAVKEMWLDKYAEAFAEAGMAALVYDNRNFGASDGEPRFEIDPWAQVHDYRHAITYVRTLPEVDRERIGIWGSSYSGGHVIVVGAVDRRVKAVVAQVPATRLYDAFIRNVREDFWPGLLAALDTDREARFRGEPPGMIPVVSEDPMGGSTLPQAESWKWFTETAELRAPSWRNEVTLQSLSMALEYEPWALASRVSPTPLLMLVATKDDLIPTVHALETYEMALEPKKLVLVPGGHFGAYVDHFALTGGAAVDWFVEHLKP